MSKKVTGDILAAGHGIICHQVNCQMVMGAGLALAVRSKWPHVYTEYRQLTKWDPKQLLGRCQVVEVEPKTLYVANLFGQFNYGRKKGVVYTDYGALGNALTQLKGWHAANCHPKFPIWIPYGMGCNLAGGNWEVVRGLIDGVLPDAFIVRKVT